jgi:UDP-glucose 4-epimerase
MKKNILLTGGAGYIGSHVTNLLIDKGFSVTVIDNLITGNKSLVNKKANLVVCDISNVKKVKNLLKKKKFDIVLHFAGLIRVDESLKKPQKYLNYNFDKSKIFFNTCYKNGIRKIIFSSTASVYGNSKKLKVNENDSLKPSNPYASSKLLFEKYLMKMSKTKDIKFVILRYFNVAGADQKLRTGLFSKYSTHLIKIACEVAINKRKKLVINGADYNTIDGTPVRDYIHVSDLADIHLISTKYLLKNGLSQIFNCGYGRGFSVKQVINVMNQILKKKLPTSTGKRRKGDIEKLVADVRKFKKFFSWKPKYDSLKLIINSALKWEKKLLKN